MDFWYLRISRNASVPGLYLLFLTPPVAGMQWWQVRRPSWERAQDGKVMHQPMRTGPRSTSFVHRDIKTVTDAAQTLFPCIPPGVLPAGLLAAGEAFPLALRLGVRTGVVLALALAAFLVGVVCCRHESERLKCMLRCGGMQALRWQHHAGVHASAGPPLDGPHECLIMQACGPTHRRSLCPRHQFRVSVTSQVKRLSSQVRWRKVCNAGSVSNPTARRSA